ncbi:hypothetical protein KIW84_061418 [Lathyrus oleraceus]|uniref:Uncharacterized protein n=1 Tax=Pisum sativum TaxID=3888 RepID=A0A9D5A479_PEA|nr:hypothetical protein KIW84_061418 [Pisum sativum]
MQSHATVAYILNRCPTKKLKKKNSDDVTNKPLMSYGIDKETDELKVEAVVDIPDTIEVEEGVASIGQIPHRTRVLPVRLQDYEVVGNNELTPDGDLVHFSVLAGQQFVDVNDYQRLVAENKDFKERISVLEDEMRMMKEARVNTPFEDEDVQDDRQIMNFINKDEVGISSKDVGHNTPFNNYANVAENKSKYKSNMATRMKKKLRKRGKTTRINL